MRLHRFFIEQQLIAGKPLRISDTDLLHQWKNVFRLGKGDAIILLDNSGYSYTSEIVLLAKDEGEVLVGEKEEVKNIPRRHVTLVSALPKKDTFEWILEKGTELGVSVFVPVVSERSEKKDINHERSRKIIKEASEQSGRGILPQLLEVQSLEEAITRAKANTGETLIAFHLEGESFSQEAYAGAHPITLFIGPEGGWSEKEVGLFKTHSVPMVCLGTQVLRAETAAIAATSLLLL